MHGREGCCLVKLDHVVYFTKKSPADIVSEQRKIGWHTVVGGSHKQWGTYNALMYVSNAYIEWLSLENEQIATQSENPLVKLYLHDRNDGEGWGTACLSVNGIEDFNEQLITKGYKTSGVLNAERATVQGAIRKWKMVFIEQAPSDTLPYPFFIEWETEERTRWNELRQDGTVVASNEKLAITECLFSVKNATETTGQWATLLGVEKTEDTVIQLSNCSLKFIDGTNEEKKERLADISIEHL